MTLDINEAEFAYQKRWMKRKRLVKLPFQADSPIFKSGEGNRDRLRYPNGNEWFDDHEELFLSPFGMVCLYHPYLARFGSEAPEVSDGQRLQVEAFAAANHMTFAIGKPGTGSYAVRGEIRQGIVFGTVSVAFVLPTASPRGESRSVADALALARRVVKHVPASRSELEAQPKE